MLQQLKRFKLTQIDKITRCLYCTKPQKDAGEIVPTETEYANPRARFYADTQEAEAMRQDLVQLRFTYPEFLPNPDPKYRHSLAEKLMRADMLARRTQVDIPEFFVGTIMAVTTSDRHAPEKPRRFLGICIERNATGLLAEFTLRNVIDHQGIEIRYSIYDPTIISVDVIRLERRIDPHLRYLRDALPEYSTFDQNMEAEVLPEGSPVPLNEVIVTMKQLPWCEQWQYQNLKGLDESPQSLKRRRRAREIATPWEKYDIMKQYMNTIPMEEQAEIYSEVQAQLHTLEVTERLQKKKRVIVKPQKRG